MPAIALAHCVHARGPRNRYGAIHLVPPRPDWEQMVDDFLAGHQGSTRAAYRSDLADFARYCQAEHLEPLAAGPADLQRYLDHLCTRGLRRATVIRRRSTLRNFFKTGVQQDSGRSPADDLKVRVGTDAQSTLALTKEQVDRLLAAADAASPQIAAMAWLLAQTGLRISEACRALAGHVHLEPNGDPWLEVTCKNGVRRSVPLHPQTWARLEVILGPDSQGGPLMATRNGTAFDRHNVARTLRRLGQQAGIPIRVSPQVLRASVTKPAGQAGYALADVQHAVGHVNAATTRAYDRTVPGRDRHPGRMLEPLADPVGTPSAPEVPIERTGPGQTLAGRLAG